MLFDVNTEELDFDVVHASAAWAALADRKLDFTTEVTESNEFRDLILRTEEAFQSPNMRWRESVQRTSARSVGNPVAIMLWSLATLFRHAPAVQQLVPLLAHHMKASVSFGHAQNVANAVWALGIMHTENDGLDDVVEALGERAMQLSEGFQLNRWPTYPGEWLGGNNYCAHCATL